MCFGALKKTWPQHYRLVPYVVEFLFTYVHVSLVWNISFCSFPFMVTAIFVPISFPMPTCLIHAAFDLWRIVKKNKLSFLIFFRNIFIEETFSYENIYLNCITSHMHIPSIHNVHVDYEMWSKWYLYMIIWS